MLLQVLDNPDTDVIWHEAILGATSVVDYAMKSTVFLFKNELGESDQQKKQRKILQYIAKYNGVVKRSKLQGSRVLDGGKGEYDYTLESLEAANLISVDKSAKKMSGWNYILTHNED